LDRGGGRDVQVAGRAWRWATEYVVTTFPVKTTPYKVEPPSCGILLLPSTNQLPQHKQLLEQSHT